MRNLLCLLFLLLCLTPACDDDGSPAPSPDAAPASDAGRADATTASDTGRADADLASDPRTLSGVVRYEDRHFDTQGFTGTTGAIPARGITVELLDADTDALIEVVHTDADGRYRLTLPDRARSYRIRALAQTAYDGFEAQTTDAVGRAVYAIEKGPFPGDAPRIKADLLAGARDPVGGAFNIVDTTYDAFTMLAAYTEDRSPSLTYRWSPGLPFSCGSCYIGDIILLGGQLEDPDEYDDHIILHEFGHYFVEHFSADSSPGGQHRDERVSPQLAYGEGVAYFFAAMVSGGPDIIDNFLADARHIDLEAVTQQGVALPVLMGTEGGGPEGSVREEVVAGIMWDAYDADDDAEPFDTLSIGVEGHMGLLLALAAPLTVDLNVPGIDLADWLNLLTCAHGAEVVQPLVDDRAFPWDVAEAARCKTRRIAYALEPRGGDLWLVARDETKAPLNLNLRHHPWSSATGEVTCRQLPCRVGPAKGQVVLTGPSGAVSWLDAASLRAQLGGRVVEGDSGPVRIYPSR